MSGKKASGQEGYLADILRDMGFRKYPEGRNAVTDRWFVAWAGETYLTDCHEGVQEGPAQR